MNRPNAVTIDQTTAQLVWKINAFLETIEEIKLKLMVFLLSSKSNHGYIRFNQYLKKWAENANIDFALIIIANSYSVPNQNFVDNNPINWNPGTNNYTHQNLVYNNYIHQNSSDSNFARRDLTIHQNDFIDQNNVIQTDVFSDNVLITRTMLLA
ncbi:8104_t:CDS:2 [Entrophospora sp. SA101]|nr:8104_t:CDS:2 [Entrophospora sp. SA101]